jgi:transcription elongation factor Elf1
MGGTTHRVGETVSCQKCGRKVKIDVPRKDSKGKILLASVDDMMPFAFRCRQCDFITCAECALLAYELHNPRQGIPTCPSCGKVAAMFFTEWLAIKGK